MVYETLQLSAPLNFDARLSLIQRSYFRLEENLIKLTVIINSLEARINKFEELIRENNECK